MTLKIRLPRSPHDCLASKTLLCVYNNTVTETVWPLARLATDRFYPLDPLSGLTQHVSPSQLLLVVMLLYNCVCTRLT